MLESIDERLCYLDKMAETSKNNRKRDKLEQTLKQFLYSLPNKITLDSASPYDIKRFLAWKDNSGKTKVHSSDCKFLGKLGNILCSCPTRMASASVMNVVQHLIEIFNKNGRGRTYNDFTEDGNPAASSAIRQYVKCIKEEQAMAHVLPKQAKPIFVSKLKTISQYIIDQLSRPDLTPKERYIY